MKLAVDALNLRNDRRGMGRIVRSVLRSALQSGVEITLLTREGSGWNDDPDPQILAAVRFAQLATARHPSAYDAIWFPWNGIRFRAAARSLAHIHDTFGLHERSNWIARRRVRKPLRRAAREATRIATDSAWSSAQIQRELRVRADRIVVILPVPDPLFYVGGDASLPAIPYVLMVGAQEPRKNARFLIRSFNAAFPDGDVRLIVVGNVPRDAEREARKLGVEISLEPNVDDVRLRALYRDAACVAVPSLAEGFGLVVVEAQACGAPVIASDASALPEAAGGAAMLVSPRDEGAWRDALRSVVRDEAVNSRLRALGVARWGPGGRDEPARAILSVLHDLADQGL